MKIILCDDEKQTLELYRKKLEIVAAKKHVDISILEFSSSEKLIFELEDNIEKYDLIYMDINFEERQDGINATKKLRHIGYNNEIVFLTKDKSRVFESFDVEPLHYLVKENETPEKFEEIFLRASKRIKKREEEFIALSCAGDNRNISIDSIYYFEVIQRLINVHYENKIFEFYSTMGKLENLLCKKGFMRVHRGYLANLNQVVSLKSQELTMKNGETIPVGRTYSKLLKEKLTELNCLK